MNIHYEMSYRDCEQLIKLFREYASDWSWEEWEAAGAADREEVVTNAIAEFGPYVEFDIEDAYELFYDWAEGLNKENFEDALHEDLEKRINEWRSKKYTSAKEDTAEEA